MDKDKIFDDLVRICKDNNFRQVHEYFSETCVESLGYYHSAISHQSDFFWEQKMYFCDEEKKIFYMENGWGKGAEQILLDFKNNTYRYDSYELPSEQELGEKGIGTAPPMECDYESETAYKTAEKEYFAFWEEWNEEHNKIVQSNNVFPILKNCKENLFDSILKAEKNRKDIER